MPSPLVRRALPEDASALVDLVNRIARTDETLGIDRFPLSAADEAEFLRRAEPTVYLTLLADDQGRPPLGVLTASRGTDEKLRHVSALAIAVAPEARRRGIASALLAAFFDWAGEVGVEKCTLSVLATNAPAIGLFQKAGFTGEARRMGQFRIGGALVDEILMSRWLRARVGAHA